MEIPTDSMTELMMVDQKVRLTECLMAPMTEQMKVDQKVRLTEYLMASMTEQMKVDQKVRLKVGLYFSIDRKDKFLLVEKKAFLHH